MHPVLNAYLAESLVADRREAAERARRARSARPRAERDRFASVTVRLARPEDAEELARLAGLEGRSVPESPALVAEVEGRLLAARALAGGPELSDPFRATAHLVELLELRSLHLRAEGEDLPPRRGPRTVLRVLTAPLRL
jgi:hypothetical protein